jgi:hypothetical protein
MRRCLAEAIRTTSERRTYDIPVKEHPLMQRQLMKLMVPTEQALTATMFTAAITAEPDDPRTADILRFFTPVAKFRACRDNIPVATGAMEARGGNGYIEEWTNARLYRDAPMGVLWEGTSNISSIDAIRRGVGKERAHLALADLLRERLGRATGIAAEFRERLEDGITRAWAFAEEVAAAPENERFSRQAAGAVYHASTAALLAVEGAALAEIKGDARRLLLARFVLDHRLDSPNPMHIADMEWEEPAALLLLEDAPISLDVVNELVTA